MATTDQDNENFLRKLEDRLQRYIPVPTNLLIQAFAMKAADLDTDALMQG